MIFSLLYDYKLKKAKAEAEAKGRAKVFGFPQHSKIVQFT